MNHDHYDSPLHESLANDIDRAGVPPQFDPVVMDSVHLDGLRFGVIKPVPPPRSSSGVGIVHTILTFVAVGITCTVLVLSHRDLKRANDALAEGHRANKLLADENKQLKAGDLEQNTGLLISKVAREMIEKGATEFHASAMVSDGSLLRIDAHMLPMDPKNKGKAAAPADGKAKL